MIRGAKFSDDEKHRFCLWRIWKRSKGLIMFIGLNPSTADGKVDDATIRRLIGFTRSWGYGGFYIVNVSSRIATDCSVIKDDWNRFQSLYYLEAYSHAVEKIVCMWGNQVMKIPVTDRVTLLKRLDMLGTPKFCFGTTQKGHPLHPLYLSCDQCLQPYTP